MLNLALRDEFLGSETPKTAISLRRSDKTGAADEAPEKILEITYPTADVQTALRALGSGRPARPIVLLGDRGRGKSHIMAVMHHAVTSPDVVEQWAHAWGQQTGTQSLQSLSLQRGYIAISEPVHNNEYPLLWELLFERHPQGQIVKGRFLESGKPYPPRSLLEQMFTAMPTVLILDEFQKWFDGLPKEGPGGIPYKEVASGFIQILSEMSEDRPELITLVVSVLNNQTEAFAQVERNTPVIVNFKGPKAKQDRLNLLQHRLFKNRSNIPVIQIRQMVSAYADERYRLRFSHLPATEEGAKSDEVAASWPFAPELVDLLEDHILLSEAAQDNRDLIRILAAVGRERCGAVPLITASDFFVDADTHGVQALLDSIATHGTQSELLEIAQRNLGNINSQGLVTGHCREIISALWMRSMTPGREPGGTRQDLQLDITRDAAVDDNAFLDELLTIKDNSVNIHGDDNLEGRIWFGPGENAKTKVRSTARNDRLWQDTGGTGPSAIITFPGKDIAHIRKTLRHILVPDTRQSASKVIVLGPSWETNPWADVEEETDKPENWTQPVLLVIPVPLEEPSIHATLGAWLATNVPAKRNLVRFLLPKSGAKDLFTDGDLRFMSRCSYLTTQAWKDDPLYRGLGSEFDRPLRQELTNRFDRFVVLSRWDYRHPDQCRFDPDRVNADQIREKGSIPLAVDEQVRKLFDPLEFENLVRTAAISRQEVGKLVDSLREPPPSPATDAIPFLGDTALCEEILKVVAKGKIVLNVNGSWVGRLAEHQDDAEALHYIRPRAFRSAQEMRQVELALPAAAGSSAISGPSLVATPPMVQPAVATTTANAGAGASPSSPLGGATLPPLAVASQSPTGDAQQIPAAVTTPIPMPTPPLETLATGDPANGVNLIGSFEQWGLAPASPLEKTRIEFEGLTVQQVKSVLQRLPSNICAKLEVQFRRDDTE